MSFGVGDLTGLVGLAVVGAVAVKTVDAFGNVIQNTTNQANQPQKKKKKSMKKSNNNNIFDMGNAFEPYPTKKKSGKSQNVFSTGFF